MWMLLSHFVLTWCSIFSIARPHFPISAFFRACQCLALLGLMTLHDKFHKHIRTFTQPTSFIIIAIQINVHLLFAVYDTTFFLLFCLSSMPLHQPVSYLIQLRCFTHTSLFLFSLRLHIYTSSNFLLSFVSFMWISFPFGPFLSSFLFFRTDGQQLGNYMPIIGSYQYSFLCLDYVYFRCGCTLMYLIRK